MVGSESLCEPFVEKMVHFKEIRCLEDALKHGELDQKMLMPEAKNIRQDIIELSLKYQLLSDLTSFLCQEKQLVDGRSAELRARGQSSV